jgi:hypothetical protein
MSRTICDVITAKKRMLRRATERVGLGVYSRRRFLARLNAADLSQMSENLARVLELIAELNSEKGRGKRDLPEHPHPPTETPIRIEGKEVVFFNVESDADALLRELNYRMERYKTLPIFRLSKGTLRVNWGQSVAEQRGSVADLVLVPLLIDALDAKDIQKLARCQLPECRRWFFKRTGEQRFCPAPATCRQKAFASTPEFRAERAEYMRHWRDLPQNKITKPSKSKAKRRKS